MGDKIRLHCLGIRETEFVACSDVSSLRVQVFSGLRRVDILAKMWMDTSRISRSISEDRMAETGSSSREA